MRHTEFTTRQEHVPLVASLQIMLLYNDYREWNEQGQSIMQYCLIKNNQSCIRDAVPSNWNGGSNLSLSNWLECYAEEVRLVANYMVLVTVAVAYYAACSY